MGKSWHRSQQTQEAIGRSESKERIFLKTWEVSPGKGSLKSTPSTKEGLWTGTKVPLRRSSVAWQLRYQLISPWSGAWTSVVKCFNFPWQSYILLCFQRQLYLVVLQEAKGRPVSTFDPVEQLGSCTFVNLSLPPGCSMDETQVVAPTADILYLLVPRPEHWPTLQPVHLLVSVIMGPHGCTEHFRLFSLSRVERLKWVTDSICSSGLGFAFLWPQLGCSKVTDVVIPSPLNHSTLDCI